MATYRISGVWKNADGRITHYAFHTVNEKSIHRSVKISKSEAIALVEAKGNIVTTWMWNYELAKWRIGENVEVIEGKNGKYLRSDPDNTVTDNLGHLIDFDWIAP